MELALAQGDRLKVLAAAGVVGAAAFALGYAVDGITIKMLLVPLFVVMGIAMVVVPFGLAIQVLFFYLGVEGMLKLLTNYNPIIHVGSDLIVASLCGRAFLRYLLRKTDIPEDKPPLLPLIALHLIWFLIEFANPYSLGLVPSLAGAKVYVIMLTLYFFGYYLIDRPQKLHPFMVVWIAVAVLQVVTSLYQSYVGPASVLSLGPYYVKALQKFQGRAFRPFGTTHTPGAPSVFIYLAIPFTLYFLFRARSYFLRFFLIALLPGMIATLLFCQVRVEILRAIVGAAAFLLLGFMRASPKVRARLVAGVTVVATLLIVALPWLTSQWTEGSADNAAAVERSLSVFDYQSLAQSRSGALGRIIAHAQAVPLGAGLSHAGAAAGVFWERLKDDPFFPGGFFGDNFWATTIAEIGVPGSAILTAFIFGILIVGYRGLRRTADPDLAMLEAVVLCSIGMVVIGLWGNESIIYNPESPYFWFFAGALMKLTKLEPQAARLG